MTMNSISFPNFKVNYTSLYIVHGLETLSIYHVLKAVEEKAGKRKFLLFIPKGSLSFNTRNWEDWSKCKKASFTVMVEDIAEDNEYLDFCYDVDDRMCQTKYKVLNAKSAKEVQAAVDQKDMFLFDEEILKVNESVFPLKFKKEKTNGMGFREIRNSIDINTAHILTQKTEKVKTKFLSNDEEKFLTKVQVVNRSSGTKDKVDKKKKTSNAKTADKEVQPDSTAQKRTVEKVQEEVYTSKRGRVSKKRS